MDLIFLSFLTIRLLFQTEGPMEVDPFFLVFVLRRGCIISRCPFIKLMQVLPLDLRSTTSLYMDILAPYCSQTARNYCKIYFPYRLILKRIFYS